MGSGFETEYMPIPENAEKYKAIYADYSRYGEVVEIEIMKK